MLYYKQEGLRQYELRAETEAQCTAWIDALRVARYNYLTAYLYVEFFNRNGSKFI